MGIQETNDLFKRHNVQNKDCDLLLNTPELKKCILPTFQEVIVWVM